MSELLHELECHQVSKRRYKRWSFRIIQNHIWISIYIFTHTYIYLMVFCDLTRRNYVHDCVRWRPDKSPRYVTDSTPQRLAQWNPCPLLYAVSHLIDCAIEALAKIKVRMTHSMGWRQYGDLRAGIKVNLALAVTIFFMIWSMTHTSLQWRDNERDGVSNHLRLDCLLNHLLRRRLNKTSKFRVTSLCEETPPVDFPHTGQVTRKMFPFDDVIMNRLYIVLTLLPVIQPTIRGATNPMRVPRKFPVLFKLPERTILVIQIELWLSDCNKRNHKLTTKLK